VAADPTQQRSGEPAASRAEAAGGGDLQGALHDVANALTVILGWLANAEREVARGRSGLEALTVARAWARHGRGIARRAIGAPAEDEDAWQGAVSRLVRDAVEGVRPEALARGIALDVAQPESVSCAELSALPAALQVLANLLTNAVAFTPAGKRVSLTVRARGERRVAFEVRDEGPGLSEDVRDRLFEGVDSTRRGGTGIGLRHAHALAESHGASLRLIESSVGAAFELEWPTAGAASEPSPPRTAPAGLLGKRILVVDDDAAVTALLEVGLEARGASVVTARDAGGVRVAIGRGPLDAVLLDLSPLGAEAQALLGEVRAANPSVKLVLISGSAVLPQRALLEAAAGWVRKPFEIEDVVAAIGAGG
jgi:CheY-like chemotaxis protein